MCEGFVFYLCLFSAVNNVGVIVERPMKVHEMTEECLNEHINVNIVPVSVLSRTVIPQMLEKHRGAIVNLSSVAGLFPAPLFAVYGASKVNVLHCVWILHNQKTEESYLFEG